jgi:lipid-A-disaccharide synthase
LLAAQPIPCWQREIDAMKIFLSAGEASGELYGAQLIPALSKLLPTATFFGMGGRRMESAGLRRVVNAEDVAVMGLSEVVRHLPRLYRKFRKLKASIEQERPSLAILIDLPDFHFKLAKELHRLGIPVLFFISPQLWAWKEHRIRTVQKYVDRMVVIFPFEEQYYRERGVHADYVGHPLADLPLPNQSRAEFASQYKLDSSKEWIGLLPGSRIREIRLNLPTMLTAAHTFGGAYQYLLPIAPTLTTTQRASVEEMIAASPNIRLLDDARGALHQARASIVASGTATVEAALIGNPFVVVYRVSRITFAIVSRMVKVPFIAMANLIANRRVVPELIQQDFTAANIVTHLRPMLVEGAARTATIDGLREVANKLHADRSSSTAIEQLAGIAATMLSSASVAQSPNPPQGVLTQ